jgi:outer membrane murein-binding lipoprotein Lpp
MKGLTMEQNMESEERLNKLGVQVGELNARMFAVEKDLAGIKSNYATKADVLEAKNSVIAWVISAVFLAQLLPVLLKKLGG